MCSKGSKSVRVTYDGNRCAFRSVIALINCNKRLVLFVCCSTKPSRLLPFSFSFFDYFLFTIPIASLLILFSYCSRPLYVCVHDVIDEYIRYIRSRPIGFLSVLSGQVNSKCGSRQLYYFLEKVYQKYQKYQKSYLHNRREAFQSWSSLVLCCLCNFRSARFHPDVISDIGRCFAAIRLRLSGVSRRKKSI